MQLVLGDYATPIRNSTFLRSQNNSEVRFALSALKGKRFAYANEIELGQRWAGERLKEVSGGGDITVERKYAGLERMLVQSTIWLIGNSLPYFPPADSALQRRMALLEAKTPIAEKDNRRGFADHLARTEGPAILARMVEASQRYVKCGKLLIPESIRRAVDERYEEDDLIMEFIGDACELGPECVVSTRTLFQTYSHWAKYTVETLDPLRNPKTLLRLIADHPRLKKLGHEIVRLRHVDSRDASSPRGLRGIGVREQVTNLAVLSR
jgi:P4 family phage/plasmid primase-like protien